MNRKRALILLPLLLAFSLDAAPAKKRIKRNGEGNTENQAVSVISKELLVLAKDKIVEFLSNLTFTNRAEFRSKLDMIIKSVTISEDRVKETATKEDVVRLHAAIDALEEKVNRLVYGGEQPAHDNEPAPGGE